MRKYLLILLCFLSLPLFATKYYIDEAGTDDAGEDGSISEPWATLSYAATRATSAGDTIFVNAGTYTETTKTTLAVGVSIMGEGVTSIIVADFIGNTIELTSASYNTNGNQSISYLKFDGNSFTGDFAIYVTKRGNVKVHHCTFENYDWTAIYFKGDASSKTTIAEFSYDNEAYNNTITDCSNYDTGPGKGVELFDQGGSLVYNNTITQTGRASGSNGGGIGINGGVDIKIYDNIVTCDPTVGDDDAHPYNFAVEMWDMNGGIEIYDNDFYNGAVDIAGSFSTKGSYDYSVSIHDNFIGRTALTSLSRVAIYIEAKEELSDILIYNNHIKYVQRGIHLSTYAGKTYNNVSIYYNIFDNIGKDVDGYNGWGFYCPCSNAFSATNWRIDNNIFVYETERAGDVGMGAIRIPNCTGTTTTYWYIRNNIIINFDYSPIYAGNTGTIDYLWIQNNIIYNNGNSNDPMLLITPTHYTNSDNIESDPQFDAGSRYLFFPESDSPVINAGLDVGLTLDYLGNEVPFGASEDIGAYEYGSAPPVIPNLTGIVTYGGKPVTKIE